MKSSITLRLSIFIIFTFSLISCNHSTDTNIIEYLSLKMNTPFMNSQIRSANNPLDIYLSQIPESIKGFDFEGAQGNVKHIYPKGGFLTEFDSKPDTTDGAMRYGAVYRLFDHNQTITTICYVQGAIGWLDNKIFVSEGSIVTFNDQTFQYINQKWEKKKVALELYKKIDASK